MKRTLAILVAGAAAACAQGLGGMAVGILDQAKQSLAAVSQHDRTAAMNHIQAGEALATEILQATVTHPRPIQIEVGRNTATTTTYVDVKHKNGEMSANRLKKNTTIGEVQQQVSVSMLDIGSAQRHLQNAQTDIAAGNWEQAAGELKAIPESVIETKLDGDVPLLRAQENLELARARILENRVQDAAGPLRAAAQALGDFQRLFPGPHAGDAAYMQQQMLATANRISSQGDTVERINVTWLPQLIQWQKQGGAKNVQ